jgi:hypothetical protein
MKTIRVHSAFHELFGEEITLIELLLIFIPAAVCGSGLFAFTRSEWNEFPLWKTALLFLFIFYILAGFIANLTRSTNNYYRERPRLRLIFIAIHIQPLIFALLTGGSALVCAAVWVYTILSAYGVNALAKHPAQKPAAAALVLLGLTGLLLASKDLAFLLTSALCFYQLKLIYSFAVDHYTPAPSAG